MDGLAYNPSLTGASQISVGDPASPPPSKLWVIQSFGV